MAWIKIEKAERNYFFVTVVLLALAIAAIIYATADGHAALPEPAERVDPKTLDAEGSEFAEPGLKEVGPNEYDLVMVAQAWAYTPQEVTVPKGSKVNLRVTSRDVVHGLRIPHTNVNAMIIPGQVTEVTVDFDDEGLYSMICHEYCGIQHHRMGGRIIVEE